MEVQEAIKLAKRYVLDVFADEDPSNVGLEEVEFDDGNDVWNVTIGFSRPWNSTKSVMASLAGEQPPKKRAYKVVRLRNADGKMIGIKRRDIVTAD
jgi:hypothetical protein